MLPVKEAGMVPLAAEILTEQVTGEGRTAVRRSLRLGVRAQTSGEVAMALILNISETGLLLETAVPLRIGELLQIDLPDASASALRVVWRMRLRAGCEFVGTFPKAALSAAILASPNASLPNQLTSSAEDSAADDWTPEQASIRAVLIVLCSVAFLASLVLLAAVSTLLR